MNNVMRLLMKGKIKKDISLSLPLSQEQKEETVRTKNRRKIKNKSDRTESLDFQD